ncbi:glycosyltransferase [Robertmurraya korlensis]|uniref:CgeB family protein n=1 Tax=Robertmurraya korlensis TaxID=519977 RepID=UPI0020417247|nr:glycosyltransferase [Robertmurraya korlensis]MCM3603611.1 glycosyltransferase [Robertmurraya korlensis]
MKVLFFDSNYVLIHLLPNGFKSAGHEVELVGNLDEKKIVDAIENFKPDLIITQGWGAETEGDNPDLIHKHVKMRGIPHVYWSVEDPRYTETFAYPCIKRLNPDFVFTICKEKVQFYRENGFPCEYLQFGYEQNIHFPGKEMEEFRHDVVLVANSYVWDFNNNDYKERLKYLEDLVFGLIEEGIRIDFFGRGWEKMGNYLGKNIPSDWLRGPISYIDTGNLYRSAKIVLGLQSFNHQLTHRTYEILGSKGFLITNDTEEIRRLFVPGHDLVVTNSPEETIKLVKYFLKTPEQREVISAQGYETVKHNTYHSRAEEIVRVLKKNNVI